MPSSGLPGHQAHMWCTRQSCRQMPKHIKLKQRRKRWHPAICLTGKRNGAEETKYRIPQTAPPEQQASSFGGVAWPKGKPRRLAWNPCTCVPSWTAGSQDYTVYPYVPILGNSGHREAKVKPCLSVGASSVWWATTAKAQSRTHN